MKNAVIFDLDGTLWDTSDIVYEIWNSVFSRHDDISVRVTPELMRSLIGKTINEIGEAIFPSKSDEFIRRITDECAKEEIVYLREHGAVLYDGVRTTLKRLGESFTLCIVSNCQDGYIEAFLHAHDFEGVFDDTESFGRTRMTKGENILAVIARGNIEKAIYIGDTAKDEEAARYAGIPFVHAAYGFGKAAAPDMSIKSISEVEAAALRLMGAGDRRADDIAAIKEGSENNVYDDADFFNAYAHMPRSREGLSAAGEWHQLSRLFPDLKGKRVLDVGCGYGWHCKYAAEHGAESVHGFDISEKMIDEARRRNSDGNVTYEVCGISDFSYPENSYDVIISNLVLHYIADLDEVYSAIYKALKDGGAFILNIEHPVFTSGVNEDFIYDESGCPQAWPVDDYFHPGERMTHFLGKSVMKQHHTLTQILMGLIRCGFTLDLIDEAIPPAEMMGLPGMKDELRRPMMLLIRAVKK